MTDDDTDEGERLRERVRQLHADLADRYGEVERPSGGDGVRRLVGTILSQNVADENTARALESLERTYDDYRAVEDAPVDELAETIRVAGLPETKAERIQRALARVREETGGDYSLAFLDRMDADDAQAWLEAIKGIGPKTASVVLSFQFDKPTMAVDTHVERVAKRFGLVDPSASNRRAHDRLNRIVPDELTYSLHVHLITHGREHCTARNADCDNPICRTYCDCEFC